MGLGERMRRRALGKNTLVGVTRMKFDGDRVAFVDEWTELKRGERRWWQMFGACAHAMHIANNLGSRNTAARAVRAAFVEGQPSLVEFASDLQIVAALPNARDEMAMEVWAGGLPIVQSTLQGRAAKRGQYALAAAGLPFIHLLDEFSGDDLGAAIAVHGERIEEFGWEPGNRRLALMVQLQSMAELAARGLADDVYGLAAELADSSAAEPARKDVLLEASDRLDDHLVDGPFDDYFKLILLACSAAAYGSLQRFREHVRADEDARDAEPLVGLFDQPAGADRAVRTATWMLLCAVIAEQWQDRWQEVVDLASTVMPLDPAGLAATARQIELHGEWLAAPDEDDDSDELQPATSELVGHSYMWLSAAVTQQPRSPAPLDVAALGWGTELIHGFSRYYQHLTELEERYPDAVPTD